MENLCWKIGDVSITRLVETEVRFPLNAILPDATLDALRPHKGWLQPYFIDDEGNTTLSIHALLVESSGMRIVVDTCIGENNVPGFEALDVANNPFLTRLADAGFERESVDVVLCTHLHFDHVGWNTMREGGRMVPTFPNARYLIARTEYEHWRNAKPNPYTATYANTIQVVDQAGLIDLVDADHRINEEVYLQPTPGHTPGHVSVCIASRGERAFITGDMTHHPVQWAEKNWGIPADSDGPWAAATRGSVAAQYADSSVLVIGTHYPAPTAGHLRSNGDSHIFEAKVADI